MNNDPDHIKLLEDIAKHFFGQPNEKQSSRDGKQLRFGTHGSMSVDLTKGVWFDHESNEGGGPIDLIIREQGCHDARAAYEWAEREGYWSSGFFQSKGNGYDKDPRAKLGEIKAIYHYNDENRVLLFQVVRYEPPDAEKTFLQRRPNPNGKGGFIWNLEGVRRVPYKLPEVLEAIKAGQTIYICEGEKDCNNLINLGFVASTNPGGASKGKSKWVDELNPHFSGADVVIIADNDEPGKAHAREVANKLHGWGKRVRLLDLTTVWPECGPKCDITNWLEGHSATELGELVAKIQDWKPDTFCSRLGVLDAGDDHELPAPREWLLGNEFCRGFVSSLLGDGGTGKSALRYAQLMSLAIGRSLTGEFVFQRCRVLIISLEGDLPELRRRIWAIRLYYNITEEELKGWLYLWSPGAKGGKFLTLDKHGNEKQGELRNNIETLVKKCKIDVVSIDPFVKSHGVGESDNQRIDSVMQILTDLCATYNISVDVPHHTNKASAKTMDPGDANMGRGASAMKDAARLVYTLRTMSADEAKSFGIHEEDRAYYIRKDKGKVNTVPPKRKAVWFKLVGQKLGNRTEMYPSGDEVQTVEPWFPPDLWKGVSDEVIEMILAKIEVGLPDGRRYTDANRAKDRAAWKVVVKHAPTKNEAQAREIIRIWLKNGRLRVDKYKSPVSFKEEDGLWVNCNGAADDGVKYEDE